MALPNSPFSGTNHGHTNQQVSVAKGAQLQVSTVRRVIGNNTHSGYTLPFGATPVSTNLIHRNGQTFAVHSYLYKGKMNQVAIQVRTDPRRGGFVTPVKLAPQKVEGF